MAELAPMNFRVNISEQRDYVPADLSAQIWLVLANKQDRGEREEKLYELLTYRLILIMSDVRIIESTKVAE